MKQIIIAVIFTGFTLTSPAQIKSTFRADNDTAAEAEIIKLEFLLTALIEKGDVETYSGYLADDYVRIAANGVVSTREQVLESFGKSKMQGKMTPHDLTVRIYGTTAILSGTLDIETKSGEVVTKRSSIITKVFINRGGKWYMVSLQGTPRP